MSSSLSIRKAQFPNAIPGDAAVGDMITLVVTGRISCIREDLIDSSPYPGPLQFLPGDRETTVYVTEIGPA